MTTKRGRKRRKSGSDNNGLAMGLAIGGGSVAVVALLLVVLMNNRSDSPGDTAQGTAASPQAAPSAPAAATSGGAASNRYVMSDTPSPTTESEENSSAVQPTQAVASATAASDASRGETGGASPRNLSLTTQDTQGTESLPSTGGARKEYSLPELIELIEPAVVKIFVDTEFGTSQGSGFLVDAEGTIVTNYHVIEGGRKAEVEFKDGKKNRVLGFVAADDNRDLAVLKIEPRRDIQPLPLAASLPQKGVKVAAFGAPLGFSFTASEGIVSALRDASEAHQSKERKGKAIQTTAPISPGNSGGPLVNMYGEVIGANTFGWEGGGAQNINFAISSLDIAEVLKKKSNTVTAISPQSVPHKIGDEFTSAQDLVGTERGRVLLSQIREAVILAVPLSEDPTGRLMDFVTVSAERTITTKLRWKKVRRASELHGSTAIVVMVAYLRLSDDFDSNSATELVLHTRIICRDVDRDGHELLALVWDDREAVGQVTINALAQGIVSRQMQDAVARYFNKLPLEYRKAIRELEN